MVSTPLKYNSDTKYNAGLEYNSQAGTDLVKPVDETAAWTEGKVVSLSKYRAIVETLGLPEAVNYISVKVRATTDSLAATETVARIRARLKVRTESLGLTETIASVRGQLQVMADTLGISETTSRLKGLFRIRSETLGLTEAFNSLRTLVRVRTESLGLLEVLARAHYKIRSLAETASYTEVVSYVKGRLRIISDVLGITEAVARARALSKIRVEDLKLSETTLRLRGLLRERADSLGLTEAALRFKTLLYQVGESLSLSEQSARARVLVRLRAETLSFRDTWRRFRYNARHLYNKTYIRYTGQAVYVIRRERTRMADELLTLKETMFRARNRVAVFVHDLRMTEIIDKAIGRTVIIMDSLGLADSANYFRQLCRVVAQKLGITETVPLRLRALTTILAVAVTRVYMNVQAKTKERLDVTAKTARVEAKVAARVTPLMAIAETRAIVHCQIGRDVNVILEIDRGRDKTYEVSATDEGGRVFDLTNATVYFMVKESVKDDDGVAVITKDSTVPADIEITDAVGGVCEIHLAPADTASLAVRSYVYEIVAYDKNSKRYKLAMDELKLKHVVKKA